MQLNTAVYLPTSPICSAAIHSGAVPHDGGCAAFRRAGPAAAFAASAAHGVSSAAAGWFPTSLQLESVSSIHCERFNFSVLAVLLLMLWMLTLIRPPAAVLFAATLSAGFAYVTFEVSETPFTDPAVSMSNSFCSFSCLCDYRHSVLKCATISRSPCN
jgi:hypothetical protein